MSPCTTLAPPLHHQVVLHCRPQLFFQVASSGFGRSGKLFPLPGGEDLRFVTGAVQGVVYTSSPSRAGCPSFQRGPIAAKTTVFPAGPGCLRPSPDSTRQSSCATPQMQIARVPSECLPGERGRQTRPVCGCLHGAERKPPSRSGYLTMEIEYGVLRRNAASLGRWPCRKPSVSPAASPLTSPPPFAAYLGRSTEYTRPTSLPPRAVPVPHEQAYSCS